MRKGRQAKNPHLPANRVQFVEPRLGVQAKPKRFWFLQRVRVELPRDLAVPYRRIVQIATLQKRSAFAVCRVHRPWP